jgi:hypothetical protein
MGSVTAAVVGASTAVGAAAGWVAGAEGAHPARITADTASIKIEGRTSLSMTFLLLCIWIFPIDV